MIKIVHLNDIHPLTISDQQWLDHTNQNNAEFVNRQILLKGDSAPINGSQNDPIVTKAPFGSFYKNNLNGDRYEQIEIDPVSNGYNWQLFTSGGAVADEATALTDVRNCDSGLAVGDLVMESGVNALEVVEVLNNNDTRLIIGIVLSKPTSTTAKILFKGPLTGLSGYTAGQKVYCGTTGGMSSSIPSTGYMQILGNCSDGSHIDFSPAMHHLKRS